MLEEIRSTARTELDEKYDFHDILGNHPSIIEILKLVAQIADADTTVLIYGESGTGKELIAQALHKNSSRHHKAFVPLNCGAIPENLLESELFGHVRGAFTGAVDEKQGWFSRADGGTILLDEIQEMSHALQVKLLRILQTGEYHLVGSTEFRKSNVRIIAATNKDLEELICKGEFREELFYRLNIIDINLPPLRERRSDIPVLIQHFLKMFCNRHGKTNPQLSPDAKARLCAYDFPGNIRELKNIIERMVVLNNACIIESSHLPNRVLRGSNGNPYHPNLLSFKKAKQRALERFEREYFIDCLRAAKGNMTRAAANAGIHVTHLYSKIKQYDIDPLIFRDDRH